MSCLAMMACGDVVCGEVGNLHDAATTCVVRGRAPNPTEPCNHVTISKTFLQALHCGNSTHEVCMYLVAQ